MAELKPVIDSIAAPVIALDCRLSIIAVNEAARKVFAGLKEGTGLEAAGFKKRGLRRLLQKTLETAGKTKTTITVKEGFGATFLATIRAIKPEPDPHGAALMITFEDRTPMQDAKTMRSDFVANVSHEIRSPLTAISGFVETLQGPASDDPQARVLFLGMMEKEVSRMTNLVSDLLSLSQVEVKERREPKKIVDLNLIIQQAQEATQGLLKKRGKVLEVSASRDLPGIPGKHNDLVQVLINLLENAVNYSRDGAGIFLTARLEGADNPLRKKAVCISVRDEGEGIPAAEIPRLTERFYRVDKSRSRNVGGTGLGLAIVKHILVRHRGRLVIESTPGQGSTFSIYLPLAKSQKP